MEQEQLKQALKVAVTALEPFSEYAKAIPDNWRGSQALTITLDMPAYTKGKRGETILDIALSCNSFRRAAQALSQILPIYEEMEK